MQDIYNIASIFSLGNVHSITHLPGGKVNISFEVHTKKGVFIVQKLGHVIPGEATHRYANVQSLLRSNGVQAPVLLQNSRGNYYVEIGKNHWRVFEYIPNTCFSQKPKAVKSAAILLATFHKILESQHFESLIPHFHEIDWYKNQLEQHKPTEEVLSEYNFLLKQKIRMPKGETVTLHGDPKLANFLFKHDRAFAILDFDTLMTGNLYIDIGDALRSWCRRKDGSADKNMIVQAIEAYNSYGEFQINVNDAIQATKVITLELAIRYLTDYFEESYFEWDKKRYDTAAKHNLVRTHEMITFYKSLQNC